MPHDTIPTTGTPPPGRPSPRGPRRCRPDQGRRPRDWPRGPRLLSHPTPPAHPRGAPRFPPPGEGPTPMPADRDLFTEESSMVSMSFGEHLDDLRKHLIRAVLGLFI